MAPTKVAEMVELLIARKAQVEAELAELEHMGKELVDRYANFTGQPIEEAEVEYLQDNYSRLGGHLNRKEAELRGELTEINGLLRSLPLRRNRPDISMKRVRRLIVRADLQLGSANLLTQLHTANGSEDCMTSCTECITSCTECVTSCNGDCISCASDCVGACTSCSPSGTTGCIDTFGMQSLFNRKEKVFDPESLRYLDEPANNTAIKLKVLW